MDKNPPQTARTEMTRTDVKNVTFYELMRYKSRTVLTVQIFGKVAVIGALLDVKVLVYGPYR